MTANNHDWIQILLWSQLKPSSLSMSVRLSHSRVLLWNTPTNTRIHKRSQSSWSEIGVRADLVMLHSTHTFNQTPTPSCPHGRAQGGEVLLLFSSPRFKCLTLNISDSGSAAWERKDERNRGEGSFFKSDGQSGVYSSVCVCVCEVLMWLMLC